jgi:hypothetical protein
MTLPSKKYLFAKRNCLLHTQLGVPHTLHIVEGQNVEQLAHYIVWLVTVSQ